MGNDFARQQLAEQATQALFAGDRASRGLGMQLLRATPGSATVSMTVRADMLNGHQICHGGLIFALADSAFAFACNSRGEDTLAAGASVEFLAPAREGELLTAVALEVALTGRSGVYDVTVTNQRGERVALFRGRSRQIGQRAARADRVPGPRADSP